MRAAAPPVLLDVALVDAKGVSAAACISLSQLHDLVRAGKAPAPAFRGVRMTRWRVADVRAWLLELASAGTPSGADAVATKVRRASDAAQAKRRSDAQARGEASP